MSTVRKVPMRKCVGCGEMKSKKELIRVLRTPEGEILLDAAGRKNGRGAYLCPSSGLSGERQSGAAGCSAPWAWRIPPEEVYETAPEGDGSSLENKKARDSSSVSP